MNTTTPVRTPVRIGINGFGRMGRLVVRALGRHPELQLVHVNEHQGDVATAAHLLEFDTVHGRYTGQVGHDGNALQIDGQPVTYSSHSTPGGVPWDDHGVELVLECTGAFRTVALLEPYFERGVRKVVVAAPVKADEVNALLKEAADGELAGILGYEDRPLVSADYTNDTRSGIVDGPSTMVIAGRMVPVYIWYDNESGSVFRMAELAARVAGALR